MTSGHMGRMHMSILVLADQWSKFSAKFRPITPSADRSILNSDFRTALGLYLPFVPVRNTTPHHHLPRNDLSRELISLSLWSPCVEAAMLPAEEAAIHLLSCASDRMSKSLISSLNLSPSARHIELFTSSAKCVPCATWLGTREVE